jgi:hypothetical protein
LALAAVLLSGVIIRLTTPEGVVLLENIPPDAEVFVDGRKATVAVPGDREPLRIELPKGRHELKVTKGGFETYTRQVTVPAGQSERITVQLLPVRGPDAKPPAPSPTPPDKVPEPTPRPAPPPEIKPDRPRPAPPEKPPAGPPEQSPPPRSEEPGKPPASPALPKVKVSLKAPYPQSYPGAPTDKISVQYAVMEILKQAGLEPLYDFKKSQANVGALARKWVTPHIVDQPCESALKDLLDPLGLSYELTNGKVILRRK